MFRISAPPDSAHSVAMFSKRGKLTALGRRLYFSNTEILCAHFKFTH
jgi:hypothetical protein